VDKSDQTPFGTYPRVFVYQTHPPGFKFREGSLDVRHLDCDVVYPAAAFIKKL
jgi:hypothetical protein